MSWIKWNGISSDDMGLVVERMPYLSRARMRVQEFTVPGRAGVLHVWDGAHDMLTIQMTLNLMRSEHAEAVRTWLTGRGELISSDVPTRCWKGIIAEEAVWTRYRPLGRPYDSISVIVHADPYMYEAEPTHTVLASTDTIECDGTVAALPLLAITGEGDGTITFKAVESASDTVVEGEGDSNITITGLEAGETIYLDCDARVAYTMSESGTESANSKVQIGENNWPTLKPDTLVKVMLGGGVSGLDIQHNWRWL